MVATDIAARGLDVESISHVINFDMPDTADAYIHRIGRTGRAERTGDAFTLVTPDDKDMIRALEKIMGKPLPRQTLEGFDYDIPAPEISPVKEGEPSPGSAVRDDRLPAVRAVCTEICRGGNHTRIPESPASAFLFLLSSFCSSLFFGMPQMKMATPSRWQSAQRPAVHRLATQVKRPRKKAICKHQLGLGSRSASRCPLPIPPCPADDQRLTIIYD